MTHCLKIRAVENDVKISQKAVSEYKIWVGHFLNLWDLSRIMELQ